MVMNCCLICGMQNFIPLIQSPTFSVEYQIVCLTCLVSCTVHSPVTSGQLSKESSPLDSREASLAVNPQQDPKCMFICQ